MIILQERGRESICVCKQSWASKDTLYAHKQNRDLCIQRNSILNNLYSFLTLKLSHNRNCLFFLFVLKFRVIIKDRSRGHYYKLNLSHLFNQSIIFIIQLSPSHVIYFLSAVILGQLVRKYLYLKYLNYKKLYI